MNRSNYFDFIELKLNWLVTRLEMRGSLNILNLNIHSENFYLHFFNLLFDWKLENLNTKQQNMAGIDLIDTSNDIVVQVSSTVTRQKIESALAKDLSNYSGYSFKFIFIAKDAKKLRFKEYENPHNLTFSPKDDIFDVPYLLKKIVSMDIDQLKDIYEFIKSELKSEPDPAKIESNLTTIINILAKEDWNSEIAKFETIPYDIERKISYNQLESVRDVIGDSKIYYHRIDKIYSEFNLQGVNKSLSILNGVRRMYHAIIAADSDISSDQCFLSIIRRVVKKIQASANYVPMPEEELALCVEILIVDAFIRCKIFKNPEGDADAHS